ncbi:cell division protein FtsK [Actinoplanes sp. ATCC 53533]|uniref:FtsK/SpoIIIE domain-containing protein n=1 Tax=Actinoplanes sp. ATCC 53533 TaxID=1288362 RepID=UPI000F7B608D|nr:FtsK/SpoIIIE domain-containing protein [Actinoplanes sp. ATCC 53533]RSM59472.1 cell division protein FtsK [Actinoplanes sp. ATCC 53533]
MTSPTPEDRFDWQAAEADVVDLTAARQRRDNRDDAGPDTEPDTIGDTRTGAEADTEHDTEDDTGRPVLVDSIGVQRRPRFSLASFRDAQRVPIVPSTFKSRTEFVGNLAWAAGFGAHALAYHALRLPKYAGRVAFRTPRGAIRVVSTYTRWLFDLEGEPVRQATVRTEDAETYLKLARQRDRRVRWRGITAVGMLALLLAVTGWVVLAPTWQRWTALGVLAAILGYLGTPADKPLLDTAVVRRDVAPLTSAEVFAALGSLRIPGIDAAIRRGDNGKRWFPAPIARENGAGWRCEVELPRGVVASSVVDKREELAAALTRPLGCVWPQVNAEVHPGWLVLFVADKDMSKAKPTVFPLLKTGTANLFKPAPFGTDPRGTLVTLTLMYASMIVGSIPRMGKTFALRLILLIAALDPRAQIFAFDLKGTGDLSPLEPVAHRYRAGDDDEDIAYGLTAMRELRTEMRRRTKVIRELPRDLCPENKVTDDLANIKKLGLGPIVAGVDECQVWFEHPKYGDEFEEICTDLIKRGPATGIDLVLATQRPDAKSLPSGISANAVLRFCLKVMGQIENDMVLGTSQYKNGIRATMFGRRDRGIGYLAGEGDDPVIARTFYVDGPTAEVLVRRARGLREKAGNITGHAAGVALDTAEVRRDTVLEDLAAVMSEKKPKVWTTVLVKLLAELRPEVYGDLTADQLRAAVKAHGVKPGQVWGNDPDTDETGNRQGYTRTDILKALTERDGNGGRGKTK